MKLTYIGMLLTALLTGCIGDDFIEDTVEPTLRITNGIDTIQIGEQYQLEATYFNNVGQVEIFEINWTSSNSDVISVNQDGIVTALSEGEALITASINNGVNSLNSQTLITVGQQTIVQNNTRKGVIRVTSNYTLEGSFELSESNGILTLSIDESYRASESLPGLYIYLTNNPSTSSGAYEIGPVSVYSGAHEYKINDVGLYDYSHVLYFCKPFNVKIGDGIIED